MGTIFDFYKTLVTKEILEQYAEQAEKRIALLEELNQRQLKELSALQAKIDSLSSALDSLMKTTDRPGGSLARSSESPAVTGNFGIAALKTKEQPAISQPEPAKPEPVKEVSRTFYASYSPCRGVLEEVDEDLKLNVAFVATVKGNKGTVEFNPLCLQNALNSLSSMIFPFFDYDMQSRTPSGIYPQNKVNIKSTPDGDWKMDGRISLIIK